MKQTIRTFVRFNNRTFECGKYTFVPALHSTSWVGHSNRLRKRRRIRSRITPEQQTADGQESELGPRQEPARVTRSGRQVNRPARYLLMTGPKTSQQREGKVVRTDRKLMSPGTGSREEGSDYMSIEKDHVAEVTLSYS